MGPTSRVHGASVRRGQHDGALRFLEGARFFSSPLLRARSPTADDFGSAIRKTMATPDELRKIATEGSPVVELPPTPGFEPAPLADIPEVMTNPLQQPVEMGAGLYPGEPAGAYPGEPAGAYPGEPAGAYPGKPAGAYPGEPAGAYPGEPAGAYPGKPAGAYSGEPGPRGQAFPAPAHQFSTHHPDDLAQQWTPMSGPPMPKPLPPISQHPAIRTTDPEETPQSREEEDETTASAEVVAAASAVAGGGLFQRSSLVRVALFGALALLFLFIFRRLTRMLTRTKPPPETSQAAPMDTAGDFGSTADIASRFEDLEVALGDSGEDDDDDVDNEDNELEAETFASPKSRRRDQRRTRSTGKKSKTQRRSGEKPSKPKSRRRKPEPETPVTSEGEMSDDPDYCPL